jgi:acyl-CoA thioesterase-1
VRRPAPRFALAGLFVGLVVMVGVQVRRGLNVLASVPSHADYWRCRAESAGELLYVALGDSTAQGVGSSDPARGYVGRLAEDLERSGRSVRVLNLSVSGARVADLVRDQLPTLVELLDAGDVPALVTVTIGANDTGRTSFTDFRRDMGRVVAVLPPGSRVAEVPYFRGSRGRDAEAFSACIRELVATRTDLVLVPLLRATKGLRPGEYADDLFHPSERGYDRYYRAFTSAD